MLHQNLVQGLCNRNVRLNNILLQFLRNVKTRKGEMRDPKDKDDNQDEQEVCQGKIMNISQVELNI